MKLAMIGDSHAKVVFRTLQGLLEQKGFNPVFVRAENGWSLKKHISRGSLESIKKSKPDLILVSLGGNNQDTSSNYKNTVDQLIKVSKQIGADLVWVGPTTSDSSRAPSTERRHAWTEQFLKQYIPKYGKYISIRAFTSSGHGNDGVHYPMNFYKKWADFVAKRVKLPSKFPVVPVAIGATAVLGALATTLILLYRRSRTGGSLGLKKKGPAPWETTTEEKINRIRNQLGVTPKQGLKRKSPAPWETMTEEQLNHLRKKLGLK